MEGPTKKLRLNDHVLTEGQLDRNWIASEALSNDLIVEEIMRNLPDKEAVKRVRFLSRKCADLGFAALASSKSGCDHLKATVHLTPSMDPTVIEYLQSHGSGIKRVTLHLESFIHSVQGQHGLNLLRELLVERLTGLEHLEVMPTDGEEYYEERDGSKKKVVTPSRTFKKGDALQNLKSLRLTSRLGRCFQKFPSPQLNLIREILKVCPKLEEITGANGTNLEVLREARKTQKVKTLWLSGPAAGWRPSATIIDELVKHKPKLVELDISPGEAPKLLSLLQCNEESLEKLELQTTWLPQQGRSTPQPEAMNNPLLLAKLTTISRRTVESLSALLRPTQVAPTVPNLETVIFGKFPRLGDDNDPGGASEVVLKSVNCVEVVDYSLLKLFQLSVSMFPNLKALNIPMPLGYRRQIWPQELWCLPATVEVLKLSQFHLKSFVDHGIDAALTGIPRKVCKSLAVKTTSELQELNPEDYRARPGVLNLPKLKSLVFHCVDSDLTAVDFCNYSNSSVYVSDISRWGALDQLPDLRLIFHLPSNYIRSAEFGQVAQLLKAVEEIASVSFYHLRRP